MLHRAMLIPLFGLSVWSTSGTQHWTSGPKTLIPKNVTAPEHSSRLYVSTYDGNVTTFSLQQSNYSVSLSKTYNNIDCGKQPTWLNFDKKNRKLYCVDESWNSTQATAVLTKFGVCKKGKLKRLSSASPEAGDEQPVFTIFLPTGEEGKGMHLVCFYGYVEILSDSELIPPYSHNTQTGRAEVV